jgi:hypothetical protein
MRFTLSRAVSLAVLASSKTEADHHEDLGCSILGPPSRPVRRAHAWLKQQVQQLGPDVASSRAAALVKAMEQSSAYDALCDGKKKRLGRRVLRDEVIFPRAEKFVPRVLHLRRDELGLDVDVTREEWPVVNALFATLAHFIFKGTALDHPAHLLTLGALLSLTGRWGDVVMSSIKRDLGIKDMAATIPGHGGLLDRFDSLIFVGPALFHYISYFLSVRLEQPVRVITGH